MENSFSPSDLKTILHSKRSNTYYLQYCRVLINGGCVEYITDEGKQSLYWKFRQRCMSGFQKADALDTMIDALQTTAQQLSQEAR
ncbi:CRISPR-associated endonuclease Cas1 [Photorhabdus australis subsp. thailandensis]|uniref:CRISPR-associated endonuclease Cas1 n=1 Tax=Photorhabdus australis subsp. thailandensis TaxID=2805096 RepID=A0A1C0U2D3_9GAMM|nr:CRISPR-associated endonuclease Cas1 [Photorhabdus australis subsp. thailandensis]